MKTLDLAGLRFGRLSVLRRTSTTRQGWYWLCRRDCGSEKEFLGASISAGRVGSCGCLQKERTKEENTKHGHAPYGKKASITYSVWRSMMSRCYDEKCSTYAYYGGKGIKVCERWLGPHGFENFLKDMGTRPGVSFTIDRKDSQQDYCPENCQWATIDTQARNKSNNVWIEVDGVRMVAADWAARLGTSPGTILSRLRHGWSERDAVSTPVRQRK